MVPGQTAAGTEPSRLPDHVHVGARVVRAGARRGMVAEADAFVQCECRRELAAGFQEQFTPAQRGVQAQGLDHQQATDPAPARRRRDRHLGQFPHASAGRHQRHRAERAIRVVDGEQDAAAARQDVARYGTLGVPPHLRNAPTALAQELGHGEGYRYPHDEPNAYAAGESYFPEALQGARYYQPTVNGLEGRIAEKLERLREWDRQSGWRRYR